MNSKPLIASCAALVAALGIAVPAAAADTRPGSDKEPSLTGSGRIHYRYSPDDDIRFRFDAHGHTIQARGDFFFSHQINDQGKTYRSWGEVDCLITGGHTAVVTGRVTKADAPGLEGRRVGISVEDLGDRDRLGFSWVVSPVENVPRCLGTAPFTRVVRGDYEVEDAPFTVPTDRALNSSSD
jgi:hypothetical protein